MGLIKMRKWEIMLLNTLGLPILKGVVRRLKLEAERTPNKIDDAIIGAMEVVITFLEDPQTIEET